ncbi:MAG: 50S ribosomal protein L6 [Acidobacteriota bacterium]
MSRVGQNPIHIPDKVKVKILSNKIEFQGPKGSQESPLFEGIEAQIKDNILTFKRKSKDNQAAPFHGLTRTLAANAVQGITEGFSKTLEIVGVGFRAKLQKDRLELSIGYSKPVIYPIPEDIEIELENPNTIVVKGINKQRVGQEAQKIKSFRKPDSYKLKGIRYKGERLIKKERKAGVGATSV